MGGKRAFADMDSGSRSGDFDGAGPSSKRRKQHGKSKSKPKEDNIAWSKKRARDIERLFQKGQDLRADVRNELERELAAHRTTIADKTFQKKRSKMISRYHRVRFFERRKAMRLVKQIKRMLEQTTDSDETTKLKQELHIAEVDEAYTQHHPHAEPYVSLYTASKTEDDDDEDEKSKDASTARATLHSERPPMWYTIEKAMGDGPDALRRLRERRSQNDQSAVNGSRPKSERNVSRRAQGTGANGIEPGKAATNAKDQSSIPAGLNRRERRRLMHQNMPSKAKRDSDEEEDDDDDDDGGFFEAD